jgi:hypothetical protein
MAATFLWRAGEQLILNGQGGLYSWQKVHTQEQEDGDIECTTRDKAVAMSRKETGGKAFSPF